ncbi:MAG TPA: dihydrolipoamide acetyltransferase family protein [Gemmatimonadales bacterium]|nr:dihydrolipoamide acetyltransferase family protein [Gemmatimonadales bacterium]
MATKVVMEALSPTMEEGRLVEWKKKEGDTVAVGDVLAEVETDKAVMELVARAAGTLLKLAVPVGTTVPVANVVAWIGTPGESVGDGAQAPAVTPARASAPASAPAPARAVAPVASVPAAAAPSASGRVKASPLARKIAADRGLDLGAIAGSGPAGRVIARDLDGVRPAAAMRAAAPAAGGGYEDVPLSQIRKTIAKRLAQSIGPVPTFYLTTDVDMTRMWEAREALIGTQRGAGAAAGEVKVSFNDIIIKATASALLQHPACNAWWQDDHIRVWHEVHVGMAVAIPDGLITPVIRHAEGKSLREIAAESKDLATRARERKLTPEEYTGSTFSISNLGMLEIEHFTAIINPPEAGILAVGKIRDEAVVVEGQVRVRKAMRLTMSCDHRVIDGATGAQFLKTLKQMLENPLALIY